MSEHETGVAVVLKVALVWIATILGAALPLLVLAATLIFMPLIIIYTAWAYRVMRGKVTVARIRANEHTAY